jgi:hypothetical protein
MTIHIPGDRDELMGFAEAGAMPEIDGPDRLADFGGHIAHEIIAGLEDLGLAHVAPAIARDLIDSLHRRITRMEREGDTIAGRIKTLAEAQDGSEVADVELQREMARKHHIDETTDALATVREAAAETMASETGHVWTPRSGSRTGPTVTAATIQARDMDRAQRNKKAADLTPAGRWIIVAGGKNVIDVEHVYKTLDRVRERVPDMVLMTKNAPGLERIAIAWAAARGVTHLPEAIDWSKGKAAPFKTNDAMLARKPAGVVIIGGDGEGIPQNLASKAEAKRIKTWRVPGEQKANA